MTCIRCYIEPLRQDYSYCAQQRKPRQEGKSLDSLVRDRVPVGLDHLASEVEIVVGAALVSMQLAHLQCNVLVRADQGLS